MATETSESTDHLRRCAINGCAWRGTCPEHDIEYDVDVDLNRLMRLRPFGAGRKHQRSAARYGQSHRGKSKVTVTTIEERRRNPPVLVRRKRRIVHPDTLNAVRELTESLRSHRGAWNVPSPASAAPDPAVEKEVCPVAEPVSAKPQLAAEFVAPVATPPKPSPALFAKQRRPVLEKPVPVQPAPSPKAPRVRTSLAAVGPAVEAMRKARERSRQTHL
ncbi:hypothetical protein ACFQ68_21920 [Amycolatopsis japonica]|uniref:hypothetical protein n=1 Tax=Amycolatopsis japonica TaxID=208439 RepID=UPI0036716ED7